MKSYWPWNTYDSSTKRSHSTSNYLRPLANWQYTTLYECEPICSIFYFEIYCIEFVIKFKILQNLKRPSRSLRICHSTKWESYFSEPMGVHFNFYWTSWYYFYSGNTVYSVIIGIYTHWFRKSMISIKWVYPNDFDRYITFYCIPFFFVFFSMLRNKAPYS